MGEIVAQRQFLPSYIWLDVGFLVVFITLLLWKKKYMTVWVGLAAGLLYQIVDYGIFHLLCHARTITSGYSLFWVLLWMSMSYGFTNFTWIWLWVSRDEDLTAWSLLILLWWFCCPLLSQMLGANQTPILIQRTTSGYHGVMAAILFLGYLAAIVWNLAHNPPEQKIPLLWLLAIGVLAQFGWECALLVGGIRSAAIADIGQKVQVMLVNSLLETNLGMPYVYGLYLLYSSRFTEQLRRRPQRLSFTAALEENNALRHRDCADCPAVC